MNQLCFYCSHETKTCYVLFGVPFKFDGALINLPRVWEGKPVEVVGLTPHTVELKIDIPYDLMHKAHSICSYNDGEKAIAILQELVSDASDEPTEAQLEWYYNQADTKGVYH